MIIGKINFNTGKSAGKFSVNWDNWIICLKDYYFERNHFILKCRRCGQLLAPVVQQVGPYNCGWKKEKRGWICHQCHGHGAMQGTEEEIAEHMKMVAERNKDTTGKLISYKWTHPWVKYKEL